MTVAAGRMATGSRVGGAAAVEEPMEARRRGYRQQRAAPPGRGHPLTNLTQLMSQPASEPASGAGARPAPAARVATWRSG